MLRNISMAAVLLIAFGALSAQASEKENMEKMQRFYDEGVNKGKMAVMDELLAEDFVEHEMFPGLASGREGCKQFFSTMRTAFPDLKFDVDFMMADGDKVAAYLTISGTQKGEFMGTPATGKKFEIKCIDIVRIVDGKAVEHWGVSDGAAMMQQLGMAPPQAAGQ